MPRRLRHEGRNGEAHRAALLKKKEEVLTSLGLKNIHFATNGRLSEEDQAQASHDEYVALSLNSLDYRQLRQVEEALDRLDTGDYGQCLACGEMISPKRLQVLPWARYCVTCQDQAAAMEDEPRPHLGHRHDVAIHY